MKERYIAAIEISSSKVIGAVGKIYGAGNLEVLAVEQERGVETVRRGIIHNLEETSMKVATVIERLQRHEGIAPRKITSVYVGLSGKSLRSIVSETSLTLDEGTEITDEILDRLKRNILESAIDNSLEVVDAVPRIYKVGRTETTTPKGAVGNFINAKFDLVVSRPEMKKNIVRTLPDKLDIRIEGFVVTALATGQIIPTREEKRLGCMLVDMGAETTTVTIYKNGVLRYFATLPLGGRNITRDITTLNILEERAEEIKLTSGNAITRETPSSLNLNGIKIADVDNLISARSEEIVANIVEQIEYAGLKENDLPGGIICIGGASRLTGMTELLERHSNLTVSRGRLPQYIDLRCPKANSAELMEVVSVLYAGATLSEGTCLEMPVEQSLPATGTAPEEETPEVPERKKRKLGSGFLDTLKTKVTEMFSGGQDDSDELI